MAITVTTRSGKLAGQTRRGLLAFKGIPYAKAPTGDLRLRPPEPSHPWLGPREATHYGPVAPQAVATSKLLRVLTGPFGTAYDEDCLYLNVWTPAADRKRRPVMVWIHGGAFTIGSGSTRFYSGSRLAKRGDTVVVTLNYRLGALGFLQLPDAPGGAVSNLGIRDQIAALEWVRDNIEQFGGDPENVTVFGESAGAMSVGTLLGTPSASGLFRRAILQSGAAHHVSAPAQAARVAECFLSEAGVADVEGLRKLAIPQLLSAQTRASMKVRMHAGALPWQPAVDGDLLPELPLAAIRKGQSRSVDVLIGTNRDEWKLFMLGDRKGHSLDEMGLHRRLRRSLAARGLDGDPHFERAAEAYQRSQLAEDPLSPRERWVAFQTDHVFRYPALALADQHSAHTRTYAYLFDWAPPLLRSRLGSCHALEIPFVFGTLNDPMFAPVAAAGGRAPRRLSRRMQDAWLSFARSGDPTHEKLSDWPVYSAKNRAAMLLGSGRGADPSTFEQAHEFWGELI